MFDYGISHWVGFFAATAALVATPGPDLAYILGRTIHGGRLQGLAGLLGMCAGASFQIAMVVLGVSALIAANPFALQVIKWLGAGYLVWLGLSALRARPGTGRRTADASARGLVDAFCRAVLINLLNPKALLFYVAFLPLFVVADKGAESLQLVLHGGLVIATAVVAYLPVILLAEYVAQRHQERGARADWAHSILGVVLVGLGIRLGLG